MDASSSTIRMVRRPAIGVKGRRAGAPGVVSRRPATAGAVLPRVVVAAVVVAAAVTAVVVGVVVMAGHCGPELRLPGPELSTRRRSARRAGAARVVGVLGLVAGAGDVDAAGASAYRPARRRLAGAARVVGVLGLVAGAGDVHALCAVVIAHALGVVLDRGGALDGVGHRVGRADRIIGALRSDDDGGEDPEEGDSKNECECSTHGHHDRAGAVSGWPGAGQASVRSGGGGSGVGTVRLGRRW